MNLIIMDPYGREKRYINVTFIPRVGDHVVWDYKEKGKDPKIKRVTWDFKCDVVSVILD